MSATTSTALKFNRIKPAEGPANVKLHRGSALARVDALATGESRTVRSLRFFILAGLGGVLFAFAQFLGLI